MNRVRHLFVEWLEPRIVLDAFGIDAAAGPAWESVIVALRDEVADPAAVARAEVRTAGGRLGHVYEHAVKGFSAELPAAAVEALRNHPLVSRVESDLTMQAFAQVVPTGVQRIAATQNVTADIDGVDERVDVDIAIIDTGIDPNHPDLNVAGGYNASNGPASHWGDGHGHGTHVAGTAAALDNNAGVVGVAPGARLWAVRVLGNNGSGRLSDIIEGVDWVTQNAETIEVANMSLGGQGSSSTYREAIANSVAAGVVYMAAAGNDYRDILSDFQFGNSDDTIPAAYPEVATISAYADTDGAVGGQGDPTEFADFFGSYGDDTFADFSNFSNSDTNDVSWYDENNVVNSRGLGIDLVLPGVDIYSTYKGGGYAVSSGTSMAAPHAAGLAALHIAAHGRASDAAGVYAIRQALIDAGKAWDGEDGLEPPYSPDSPDKHLENLGWAGDAGPVDQPPTAAVTEPLAGDTVSGADVVVSADASDDDAVAQVEFFADGASIGLDVDDADGWSVIWDSTTVADGQVVVTATATDTAGQTGSDSVTVTVDNVPGASTMHVGDLDASSTNQGKTWTAMVTITVHDANDEPVADATVSGQWSGAASGAGQCDTDPAGQCTVQQSDIAKRDGVATFSVSNVEGTLAYEPLENHDNDGDSDGTSIDVNKPLRVEETAALHQAGGGPLTPSMIGPAVEAAVSHWAAAGAPPERLDMLRQSDVEIVDLGGSLLGLAYTDWIVLDRDAAGFGWSAGAGGVDLVAAVTHEFGHLLGHGHHDEARDVMSPRLPAAGLAALHSSSLAQDATQLRNPLTVNQIALTGNDDLFRKPADDRLGLPASRPQLPAASSRRASREWLGDEVDPLIDEELLELLAAGRRA